MKTLPLIVLFVACCATGTSWAAEPAAPAAKTATSAAESAAPNDDEDSQVKDKVQGEEEQAGAGKPPGEGQKTGEAKPSEDKPSAADKASPQRFVPSEEVRADFDVSFPIDI